jgi:hypothetical protein
MLRIPMRGRGEELVTSDPEMRFANSGKIEPNRQIRETRLNLATAISTPNVR